MNLSLRLAEFGRLAPGHEAMVYENQRYTYAQLNQQVSQLANGLLKIGVNAGDRVVLALHNCPEFVVSYHAILRMKGIVVPISPSLTGMEIGVIIRDCSPSLVITSPSKASCFQSLLEDEAIGKGIMVTHSRPVGSSLYYYKQVLASGSTSMPDIYHSPDDVVELLYSSGSTGDTRGAMLTHFNLYSNALTFSQICNMTPQDRAFLVAPAYHAAAQTCIMNSSIVAGSTIIIHDGWKGPEEVLKTIQEEKVTFFFGPPTMYSYLIDYSDSGKYDIGTWRVALTAAAAMSVEMFSMFEEKFGFQPTEGYGLSETSPMVTCNPVDGLKKPGSIGKTIPGVEVQIVDYEDHPVVKGEVGEIVVRGPNIMKGYYNREEETMWIMRNGWFHTGDLAYEDEHGYLFIVDRKKDLIIRGGLNVYPREVEEVLYMHPNVFEVAVVGMPDAVMGEEILAFVLLRDGGNMDPVELKTFCADKLARYKIPKYIRFVESLPKTTSGKLLRRELKGWINAPKAFPSL